MGPWGDWVVREDLDHFQQLLERTISLREQLRGAHPRLEEGIDAMVGNGQVRLASGELTPVDMLGDEYGIYGDGFLRASELRPPDWSSIAWSLGTLQPGTPAGSFSRCQPRTSDGPTLHRLFTALQLEQSQGSEGELWPLEARLTPPSFVSLVWAMAKLQHREMPFLMREQPAVSEFNAQELSDFSPDPWHRRRLTHWADVGTATRRKTYVGVGRLVLRNGRWATGLGVRASPLAVAGQFGGGQCGEAGRVPATTPVQFGLVLREAQHQGAFLVGKSSYRLPQRRAACGPSRPGKQRLGLRCFALARWALDGCHRD
eukprot:g24009.t1